MAVVVIEGATEIAALFRKIGDKDIQKANRLAFKRGADVVAAEARSHAPVRSGALQSSIRATATQVSAAVRAGNAKVHYAAPTHWGRIKGNVGRPPGNRQGINVVKGNRFIYDAAQRLAPRVVEIYHDEVMAVFARIGVRRG